ncbi:MAG: hypothetical protein ABT01_07200 [Clostridium sp. SCN 57-10]|nr:MAG: hypothetical protein ABT01_07200 [Clostridium sp. SCN 57-10]
MFLKNLYATLYLFWQNTNARYGALINTLFFLLLIGIAVVAVVRAFLFGMTYRKPRPIRQPVPDAALTERAAEALSRAIRFRTVTGERAELDKLVTWLKSEYADVFARMSCLVLPSGSLLLRWRAADKSELKPVLFAGHLDVAPAGEGWSRDPFGGKREDGLVWGRGALDCKGAVIAQLEAVRELMREGFTPRRDIYFAYGHDEETGGAEGAASIAELLQKRGVAFELVLDEGGVITKGHLQSRLHPAAVLGVGEKGECDVRIVATARPGHAAAPPRHTALGILSEAVCRIEAMPRRRRMIPTVARFLRLSGPAMAFGQRFWVSNMPFFNGMVYRAFARDEVTSALFSTTFAATDARCVSEPDRLPQSAEMLSDLNVRVELLPGGCDPSPVADLRAPLCRTLCNTINERFAHLPCIPTIMETSMDARYYVPLAEHVVRFMPIVASNKAYAAMHGPDEYIRESSLGTAAELYAAFLRKI